MSSYSTSGGSCVAVAALDDTVLVRNSRRPDRGTLGLDRSALRAFILGCSAAEFDDLA